MTPLDISPAYKITKQILKSYKNNLIEFISGDIQSDFVQKEEPTNLNNKNSVSNPNVMPVDEYYNFDEAK